ncbi:odorant receptor 22c-like [Odontomachus brunneus]|uniref:odorant receptor 22c-like n=1 Tax=Odontomachus brunneus TaxID=486640 RepID=UPI0013F1AF02|nr:odorant receptor 22c-like [Odontomachus brunneus]
MALGTAQIFQYGYVVVNSDSDNFSEFMDGVSSAMAHSLLYIKLIILWINQRLGVLTSNAGDPEKWEPYNRELILKMKFPFEISTFTIYWAITLVQFVHLVFIGFGIGLVNTLLVSLIIHVGGQIDILQDWLSKAFSRNGSKTSDEITPQMLVTKHQQIIIFSENIENLYTYIALMILLSDTLIICCLGFVIATSLNEPNAAAILVKSIMFYITMNLDVFIYCFAGEYLSAKGRIIGDAAYNSLWYDVSVKNSRIVTFIILRSQKRLTITCGRIMDLSLERFTSSIGTPDGPAILVRSVLFYMVMNLEAFIYCFAGEYLTAKSKTIGDAAYDSLWYNLTSKKSRILLLVILRSQKRLTITIGKIMDLSLERFTSVVKASASYVSVLLAMN